MEVCVIILRFDLLRDLPSLSCSEKTTTIKVVKNLRIIKTAYNSTFTEHLVRIMPGNCDGFGPNPKNQTRFPPLD